LRNRRGDDSESWRHGHHDKEKKTTKLLVALLINSFGHQRGPTWLHHYVLPMSATIHWYSEGCIWPWRT